MPDTMEVPNKQLEQISDQLSGIYSLLEKMSAAMQLMLEASKPGPEYKRDIGEYPDFDWESIDARALELDDWGAIAVEWSGKVWKRRSPDNKYGVDIWFSRCVGREEDENKYATLIMFSEKSAVPANGFDVEPLGQKATKALQSRKIKPRSQRTKAETAPARPPTPPPPPAPPAEPPAPPPAAAKKEEAPPPPAPQPAKPPATQKAESQNGNGNGEPKPDPLEGVPANLIKKAQAFLSLGQIFHDKDDRCYVIGTEPHIHTVRLNSKGLKVCDCEDFMTEVERDEDKAICAHIVTVILFYLEQKKNQPQRAAK